MAELQDEHKGCTSCVSHSKISKINKRPTLLSLVFKQRHPCAHLKAIPVLRPRGFFFLNQILSQIFKLCFLFVCVLLSVLTCKTKLKRFCFNSIRPISQLTNIRCLNFMLGRRETLPKMPKPQIKLFIF